MTCCSNKLVSIYKPRKPEKTVLHDAIRRNFNKWCHQKDAEHESSYHSQKVFSAYLKCGIPAHGFARAHCGKCNRDFFIPFSCKRRGVCPSCNQKRMVECAAHISDTLFPLVPARQWVISFPKRIRPFFKTQKIKAQVLKIVVEEIERQIMRCSSDLSNARTGGISFFQCFGAKLNYHPHFHLCYVDGVFLNQLDTLQFSQALITPDDIQDTEDQIRKRVLKLFGRKKWIEKSEIEEMLKWENSGFSLNASVRIEPFDRPALERLLRYCARPPFVSENLKWNRDILVYRFPKVSQDGLSSIQLTPLEFLDKIAVLLPQPRSHLQHYHGVFASNAPLRKKITAHANKLVEEHIPEIVQEAPTPKTKSYSWAKLLARIYEVFPLICTCGEAMKIIAFITNPHMARQILSHLKFCNNPFDPLPCEPEEWENGSQIPVNTIEWENSSQLVPEIISDFSKQYTYDYAQEPEYEMSQLVPGTEDGFPAPYVEPLWFDSS